MSDSTPSPRAKEDGTNKRVRTQQNDNTGKRIKPPENTDNNNMEVTLTSAGQGGNEAISNPNHNPSSNVIPSMNSREMFDNLYKYKQTETKLTKVEHHIDFLKTCVKEGRVPMGLRWNININVMEANEEINQELKQHQIEAELGLLKVMLLHYTQVQEKLNTQRATIESTLEKMKTDENKSTIDKSFEDLAVEKQTLSKKIETKTNKQTQKLTIRGDTGIRFLRQSHTQK